MVHNKKTTGLSHTHAIIYSTLGTILFVFIFVSMKYLAPKNSIVNWKNNATTTKELEMYNIDAFKGVNVVAQSYIVFDPISKKVLAEKNSTKNYPLASITKVMTALVAEKSVDNDKKIIIQASDMDPEGSSGLRVGDIWERDKLVQYMLSVSSNDGARSLARTGGMSSTSSTTTKNAVDNFILEMNNFAKQNNMPSLTFNNESGLDTAPGKPGAEGNVRDTANMFWYAYKNSSKLFETTSQSLVTVKSADGSNTAKNTNIAASSIPGLTISKTGFTDLALGNLGVVIETSIGRPVVIVVLHSTKSGRFTDVETLRKATLEAIK